MRLVLLLVVSLRWLTGCSTRKLAVAPSGALQLRPAPAPNEPQDRTIVRNAAMQMLTGTAAEIPAVIESARKRAGEAKGYVFEASSPSIGLRIPSARFDGVIGALSTLGKVTQKNVTARDVTAEFVDLEIRIDSARKLEARFKEILRQANGVE